MDLRLTPRDIAECISALVARNKLWSKKKVFLYFIANKAAGCFTNSKKAEELKKYFSSVLSELEGQPECAASVSYKIFSTEYAGHAKDLTQSVVSQLIATDEADSESIIVTAGGDGTSLEVQTALFKEAMQGPKHNDAIMNHITILRLPLGTGNDGTDGHSIQETIALLKGGLVFANDRAIRIYPENEPDISDIKKSSAGKNPEKFGDINFRPPWYAFNIASLGLDAYVVYLTNTVKKKLPGNFYHLCVPLAGLTYDKEFPTGTITFELFESKEKKSGEIATPVTLAAFGASGNRVYGGGHKILPDSNNFCLAPKVSLWTLLKDNHKFVDGSFKGTDLASLHTVEKIRISYDKPVLMQCDGETVMLSPAHFPLIIELTDPCLRVLKAVNL